MNRVVNSSKIKIVNGPFKLYHGAKLDFNCVYSVYVLLTGVINDNNNAFDTFKTSNSDIARAID